MQHDAYSMQEMQSEHNRARVLQHLYYHGTSSRAQIAKTLQLTPAAITKITARMIADGLIQETGSLESAQGRRSIGLTLDTSSLHVIGVKFARSLIHIGLFDLAGNAQQLWVEQAAHSEAPQTVIVRIHQRIRQILEQFPTVIGVGIAVPGPYIADEDRTAVVSSMQAWRTVNFEHAFVDAYDMPVYVQQDARAGALAQRLFAQDARNDHLAYYLLGEGVGLGVIEHDATIDGARGTATEIGHVSIDYNGPLCECGNYGCLERYCSAVAIHEWINTSELVPNSDELSHVEACAQLFALAQSGDDEAQAMVRRIGTYVGYGCVTIINAYNPSRIVLGDIVSGGGELLLEAVQQVVQERVIPDIAKSTIITLSSLPADAAVTGAAAIAIQQFLHHPSQFTMPQSDCKPVISELSEIQEQSQ